MGDASIEQRNSPVSYASQKSLTLTNTGNNNNTTKYDSLLPNHPRISQFTPPTNRTSTGRSFGGNFKSGLLRLFPNSSDRHRSTSVFQQTQQAQKLREQERQMRGFGKAKTTVEINTPSPGVSETQATNGPHSPPVIGANHHSSALEPVPFTASSPAQGNFPPELGSRSDILRPIPQRSYVSGPSSTPSPNSKIGGMLNRDDPNTSPSSTISSTVKTSKELISQASAKTDVLDTYSQSGSTEASAPPVRMRNKPLARPHFRARPQSLIENPTFKHTFIENAENNFGGLGRTSSLVPQSYKKATGVQRPLKGSPEVDVSKPYAPLPNRATNSRLINAINRRNRHSAQPDFNRTASLDELNPNGNQKQNTTKSTPETSNPQNLSQKVIYDHITKQYYSPADAYKHGIIDMNTFNRCRTKRRFLFPRSSSITSVASNGSCDESNTGSQTNFVRKIGIHDQRSNEILNLDQAYSRGILDETRYNTLKNQEMDQSFSTGRRTRSATALNFIASQAPQAPKTSPNLRSFLSGSPLSPPKTPIGQSVVPKYPQRKISAGSNVSREINNTRNQNQWNISNRSYSFNSIKSNESDNSNDLPEKCLTKNPKTNNMGFSQTAKNQEKVDQNEKKFEQVDNERGANEWQSVNENKAVVNVSRVKIQLKTEEGEVEMDLKDALERSLISQTEYDKVIQTLQSTQNKYKSLPREIPN